MKRIIELEKENETLKNKIKQLEIACQAYQEPVQPVYPIVPQQTMVPIPPLPTTPMVQPQSSLNSMLMNPDMLQQTLLKALMNSQSSREDYDR